jgi:hypothetical protein
MSQAAAAVKAAPLSKGNGRGGVSRGVMASSVEVRIEAAPAAANQRGESFSGANLRNARKSRTCAGYGDGEHHALQHEGQGAYASEKPVEILLHVTAG